MHTFQEKWVDLKEKLTKTKEKWAESESIKENKNRPKHEHNLPRPSTQSSPVLNLVHVLVIHILFNP